jgi:hypothetical protein
VAWGRRRIHPLSVAQAERAATDDRRRWRVSSGRPSQRRRLDPWTTRRLLPRTLPRPPRRASGSSSRPRSRLPSGSDEPIWRWPRPSSARSPRKASGSASWPALPSASCSSPACSCRLA